MRSAMVFSPPAGLAGSGGRIGSGSKACDVGSRAGVYEFVHGLLAARWLGRKRRTNRLGLKGVRRGIEVGRIQVVQIRAGLGERGGDGLVGGVLHFVGEVEFD